MAIFRQTAPCLPKAVRSPAETRSPFLWALVLFGFLLTGCTSEDESAGSSADAPRIETEGARWYTAEGVSRGAPIFARLCADCHGKKAQGSFTWRQRGADGKFPPPPLNGTAHAWHHPIRALGSQIKFGAPGGSGTMPGFAQALSDQDVIDLIAWFQDTWSDEIYAAWLKRELQSRASTQ
jgi:mono/diheme cytochrome c family protein